MNIKVKTSYTITLSESEYKNIKCALEYTLQSAIVNVKDKEYIESMIDAFKRMELLK